MTERRSSLAVWLIVAAMLLPGGYVLSTGPAVWLYSRGYCGEWIATLYTPLEVACHNCKPVEAVVAPYVEFWRYRSPMAPPMQSQPLRQPIAAPPPRSPAK